MSTDFKSMLRAHKEAGTCYLCKLPVLDGEERHGSLGCHWACHKRDEEEAKAIFARVGGLAVSKRKPDGEGKTAQRAKVLAVAAIEAHIGQSIYDVNIWNQKGAYRGPRWDLDAWGLNFRFLLDGSEIAGSASSLATMTACAKSSGLIAGKTDIAFTYDLYPT
jgi:hypothetical protein